MDSSDDPAAWDFVNLYATVTLHTNSAATIIVKSVLDFKIYPIPFIIEQPAKELAGCFVTKLFQFFFCK